jgi:hypothetical protein
MFRHVSTDNILVPVTVLTDEEKRNFGEAVTWLWGRMEDSKEGGILSQEDQELCRHYFDSVTKAWTVMVH